MPTEIRSILDDMRASRRRVSAALAGVPEERMSATNLWSGGPMDVRFFLLRFADHEEEHALEIAKLLAAFGFRQTEAQQILAAAEATHGELYGALVGLSDTDLDLTPKGEWPLRQTLAHILNVEERYTVATQDAAERFLAGRQYEPPANVPPRGGASMEGDLDTFLARLDAAREHTLEALSGLPDTALAAPTVWAERNVTVRFRLLRFAHHEREHTAHVLKWRRQVDRTPAEAQHLLGLAWRSRAVLEGLLTGVPDTYLDREPESGGWTLRQILDHVAGTEQYLHRRIEQAA